MVQCLPAHVRFCVLGKPQELEPDLTLLHAWHSTVQKTSGLKAGLTWGTKEGSPVRDFLLLKEGSVGGDSFPGHAPEHSPKGGTAFHISYGFHLLPAQGRLQMDLPLALRCLSLGLRVLSSELSPS